MRAGFNREGHVRRIVSAAAFAFLACSAGAGPFFAFCMDTHDAKHRTLPQQAEMLKELGYDGCGHLWLEHLPERLKTLDAQGLKLFQVYARLSVGGGKAVPDPKLKEVLPLLKGRGTQIALLIDGGKPSDASLDGVAVDAIREIAAAAEPVGVEVVLYPHANSWLETVEDAVRVARKVERKNVGAMFNLCHWMKTGPNRDYRPVLEQAMPYLRAVSISGAGVSGEKQVWTQDYILPLDQGTFDMGAFLKTLSALGYKGAIGLQCYGIGGDAREHLERSIKAWRGLNEPISRD